MANTFAVFSEGSTTNTLALNAIIDDHIELGRATEITVFTFIGTSSYMLSEKETRELVSALQARLDGEITAFSGTFNQ